VTTRRLTRSLAELTPSMPERHSLPDRIYDVLKHRILACVMEPGQKLNEKSLSEELRVSRTPLREALNRLALEGLVDLVHYKGYQVSQITVADIMALSELRRIVESEAAALAAERTGPRDYERLLELADLPYVPGNRKTYEDYLRANTSFHAALAHCAGNPRLENIIVSVLDQLQRAMFLGLDVGMDAAAATAEHLEVLKAIHAHDSVRARALTQEQLLRTEKRILASLAKCGLKWSKENFSA
jgi:GntR family transcriptional regulator, rspAB operon transcriptional repressor